MSIQFGLAPGKTAPPGFLANDLAALESRRTDTTILVVDDEPVIADTLCAILSQHGFKPNKAYNGEEALRLAETMRPQIVLTDVLMPIMSGIQMAIRIKDLLPEARIVLLSGQAVTTELMSHAAAQGHNFELLAKPIHPEDLIARLKHQP